MDVREKIIHIVASKMGVDSQSISDNTNVMKDLGADSLDVAELTMDIEDAFNFRIIDHDFDKLATVKEIVKFVEDRIS